MVAINAIACLVLGFCISPIVFGVVDCLLFKLSNSALSKKLKRILIFMIFIIGCGVSLAMPVSTYVILDKYCKSKLSDYICVLIYTVLLSFYANTKLYLSPKETVRTAKQAFKEGFTRANLNNIFVEFPLKTLINLIYITILICAQIEELNLYIFPADWSYFFDLNKYGFVIVFAIEKIFSGIKTDKERSKIMFEKFVEKERESEERKKQLKEKRRKTSKYSGEEL